MPSHLNKNVFLKKNRMIRGRKVEARKIEPRIRQIKMHMDRARDRHSNRCTVRSINE